MKARDVMTTDVKVVKIQDTVEAVAKILLENHISGLPVVDDNYQLVGIISEGDIIFQDKRVKPPAFSEILGAVIYFGSPERFYDELRRTIAYKVEDLMTKNVVTVTPDTSLEEIATLLLQKNINRVPVVEDGNLVGIITRQDLIKGLINK